MGLVWRLIAKACCAVPILSRTSAWSFSQVFCTYVSLSVVGRVPCVCVSAFVCVSREIKKRTGSYDAITPPIILYPPKKRGPKKKNSDRHHKKKKKDLVGIKISYKIKNRRMHQTGQITNNSLQQYLYTCVSYHLSSVSIGPRIKHAPLFSPSAARTVLGARCKV